MMSEEVHMMCDGLIEDKDEGKDEENGFTNGAGFSI